MKNRSRTEIITAILRSADGGNSKTRVMYEAYLSYDQLKVYLSFLKKNGMIKFDDKAIVTTRKGKSYLDANMRMNRLLK